MKPNCNVCALLESDRGVHFDRGIAVTTVPLTLTKVLQSLPVNGYHLTVCLRCHPYYTEAGIAAVYARVLPAAQCGDAQEAS